MANYILASEAGAEYYSTFPGEREVDDEIELDLTKDQERAVVAAGWVTHAKKKKEE